MANILLVNSFTAGTAASLMLHLEPSGVRAQVLVGRRTAAMMELASSSVVLRCIIMVEVLGCFCDHENFASYATSTLLLLAGPAKPDRSWVRRETKGSTLDLEVGPFSH